MTKKKNNAIPIKVIEVANEWEQKSFLKSVRLHPNDLDMLEALIDHGSLTGKEFSSVVRGCIQFTYKHLIG
jgi:hypothetical protein